MQQRFCPGGWGTASLKAQGWEKAQGWAVVRISSSPMGNLQLWVKQAWRAVGGERGSALPGHSCPDANLPAGDGEGWFLGSCRAALGKGMGARSRGGGASLGQGGKGTCWMSFTGMLPLPRLLRPSELCQLPEWKARSLAMASQDLASAQELLDLTFQCELRGGVCSGGKRGTGVAEREPGKGQRPHLAALLGPPLPLVLLGWTRRRKPSLISM